MWVLIATMWIVTGGNIAVNVQTQTYQTEADCEAARLLWQPPAQPPMTWGVQCKRMDEPPRVILNLGKLG